tara:strand:+ start:704 stop:1123 length:420 start_codon:yes stop_codon:yes gene_type:complete
MHETFADEIEKLVGIRFIKQGRTLQGLDCLGIIIYALKQMGITPKTRDDYSLHGENYSEDLIRYINYSCDPVSDISESQRGDLIVFSAFFNGYPKHLGVIDVAGDSFIHTNEELGKCVREEMNENWQGLTHSIWRIKNG